MEIRSADIDTLFVRGEATITTYVDRIPVATCQDIGQGGLAVMALYWVFDVAYPKELKKTLEFLAGHVCQLNKHKPTSAVQQILNKLYI